MKRGAQKYRLYGGIVLLAILCFALLVALWPPSTLEPAAPVAVADAAGEPERDTAPAPARGALPEPDVNANSHPADWPRPAAGATFRVTCRSDAGEVAGVAVSIRVVEHADGASRQSDRAEHADALGQVAFTVKGNIASLVVSVDTPQWLGARALSASDFVLNSASGEHDAVLELLPRVRVLLDVSYDDAVPFDGIAGFSTAGWHQTVTIRQGRGELTGMPVAKMVAFARPERPGFTMLYENIDKARIINDAVLTLILGTSKWPRSGLEVVIPRVVERYGEEALMQLYLSVVHDDRGLIVREGRMKGHRSGDSQWKNLELAPGSYTVTARCGDLVARTVVMLAVNEVSRVELTLEQGASLVAVIVDENDKPLKGAVLRYPEGPYTVFPARAQLGGRIAVSNAEGVATLKALAPTTQKLLVEAEGYEVYTLEIAPVPRASTEVRCKLTPATGRLIITLANGEPGGKYLVSYLHPYTSMGRYQDLLMTMGEELKLPSLPLRTYRIVVRGGENGPIAQANADLSDPAFDGKVAVDVSALKPLAK